MRLSLRNKIVYSIVGVIVVFGSLTTLSVFLYSKDILSKEEINTMRQTSINTADELRLIFDSSISLSKTLAKDHVIQDALMDNSVESNYEEVLIHLENFNINDNYSAVYIMLPDGTTVASTDESFVGKNYSFRSYFKNALAEGSAISLVRGVTSGELGYYFSSKIEVNEQVLGVVVMKMRPEVIRNYLDESEATDNYKFMLTDEFGIIVYSNILEREFNSLGILSPEDKLKLEEERRFDGLDIKSLQYSAVYEKFKNLEKFDIVDIYDEEEKEREMISVADINDSFFVVMEKEYEEIEEIARKISFVLSIFVILAALSAIVFVTILISISLRPLSEMVKSSKRVSKGELDFNVKPQGGVEFVELANAFNEMVVKVKESKENIEKKVSDRTAELQKLNRAMTGRELKMIELKKQIKGLEEKLKNKK